MGIFKRGAAKLHPIHEEEGNLVALNGQEMGLASRAHHVMPVVGILSGSSAEAFTTLGAAFVKA